jgi:hypothetical protein
MSIGVALSDFLGTLSLSPTPKNENVSKVRADKGYGLTYLSKKSNTHTKVDFFKH